MEPKFESSECMSLTEVFPNSYVVSVDGISQLYSSGENAFWNPLKRSEFHKQVLALLHEANWLLVKDSLGDESEITAPGEILFTHHDPDKYGFIGIDVSYPNDVSIGEEGDQTKLLWIVAEYIAAIDEE